MPYKKHSNRQILRSDSGQTLIIAIMVMFILAVLATVFIALVARNLTRSTRMSSTDAVAAIAEAGIRYADEMMTTSEDGADWRPAPDNLPPALREDDPDFEWLRPYTPAEAGDTGPTGGYTRFNSGQGRFLLRVSYNPDPRIPMSKYIKIESVGRWGNIDPDDPTTFHDVSSKSLRREITAYKPIGLTESCRFITNKSNRNVDVALGVPGYRTEFGRPTSSKYQMRGGPIRVNANLLWHGLYGGGPSVDIYLRGLMANAITDPEMGTPTDRIPVDDVLVSGEFKADSNPARDSDRVTVRLHRLIDTGGSYSTSSVEVRESADPDFDTVEGFYRDGSNYPDVNRRPRGVKRIEPPLVDQADSTNTTTRYRVLTYSSGERVRRGGTGRWVNLGQLGWGKGVYIGNTSDKQDESETLFGGVTVRADIMQPDNMMTSNWKGPYYNPPAAIINLLPNNRETINGRDQYYFTITRSDATNGRKAVWSDSAGVERPDWGSTVRMPYPDAENGRWIGPNHWIDGNGVIFAEGNIRIRGMLPKGMKLTIVSNQNIYIDGNVLKYREPDWNGSDNDAYRGADRTGGLALLARQNVIVNTTQFFMPLSDLGADDYGPDSIIGQSSSHVVVRNNPQSAFRCGFEFGPFESEHNSPPTDWLLFVRQSGEFGAAYINAWLNPTGATPGWGILGLNNVFPGLPRHVWGVGDPRYGFGAAPPGAGIGSSFAHNVYDLGAMNAALNIAAGMPNILQIALDSNVYTRSNYWMGGVAVMPMDVRIEAILYAQEGSLYVIPGYWMNPNPADTDPTNRPPGVDPRFPLYGQAPDIRIIIDGAVSENLPAAVSDVQAWMAKWGRIPAFYGSSNISTAHANEGITFLYDDYVGWPLDDAGVPLRVDKFNRPLPITPKLPVSGSLIYFGDVM